MGWGWVGKCFYSSEKVTSGMGSKYGHNSADERGETKDEEEEEEVEEDEEEGI